MTTNTAGTIAEAKRIRERNHVGSGALEFMRKMVAEHSERDKRHVIIDLQDGKLHDATDKRVKLCGWCNHYYRDKTRPNNSRTCSKKCGDFRRKERQREEYREMNPKQPTKEDIYYNDSHEYPFWSDEYEMNKRSWAYERPYATDKVERIIAAREQYDLIGGRRKGKAVIEYDGY